MYLYCRDITILVLLLLVNSGHISQKFAEKDRQQLSCSLALTRGRVKADYSGRRNAVDRGDPPESIESAGQFRECDAN